MSTYANEVRASVRESYREDIKRLRARGLTYDAIARRLSMSRSTVYRVLREERKPA